VVTVLGAGSFFGERALIGNRPRAMSVRARTAVDVLVMGKNLFTQVSASLAPLKEALGQALNRRSSELWKDHPEIEALLTGELVEKLMEPPPQPLLLPSASLREVSEAFVRHHNEFFYVSADGKTLEGVVTITDLLRAGARPSDGNGEITVASFMTPRPVTVSPNDTCATAAGAFREYRLKNLPVVRDGRLVGCIRLRKIMAFVLKHRETRNRLPPGGQTPRSGDAISQASPEPSTRVE